MGEGEAGTLLDAVRALPPGRIVLPGTDAGTLLDRVRKAADEIGAGTAEGEAVALCAGNGPAWVVAFLSLLAAGARPLLLEAGTPGAEARRLLRAAGGGRSLTVPDGDGDLPPVLSGPAGEPGGPGPAVLLPTSGSTGASRIVVRDEASLLAEGRRYRDGVGLTGQDTLLLPVPLSHAYALGWLFGGLLTGASLRPVPPAALGRIAAELAGGATVVALVPSIARMLATRRLRAGGSRTARPDHDAPRPAAAPALRLAMVGAGPVDEPLDRAFEEAFGTPLARNYGSTETGAVFAGRARIEPFCVGAPLPGIAYRLAGEDGETVPGGTPGLLHVRVDGTWHAMGDLAVTVPDGLRVIGRKDRAIRRGGRWVSPLEIEEVLRGHPDVREVRVTARRGRHPGEDGIVAEVSAERPGLGPEALREHARRELAAHKVPDEFLIRTALPTSAAGKVRAAPRYRLTPRAAEAARAYKTSEVLFALHGLGALDRLAEGAEAAGLARELGCDADALEWVLQAAAGLGVLTTGAAGEREPRVRATELAAFVRLEEYLSRGPVTREEIAAVARTGQARRPFEETGPTGPDGLVTVYQGAMNGPGARARAALGLRLLKPEAGARMVEVTAGPGRYLERLLAADPTARGHLLTVGRLSGPPAPAVAAAVAEGRVTTGPEPPRGAADLCVVANAVHGPGPGGELATLLGSLRRGGRLLVDDVFLPPSGAGSELALDWLTHGGTAWPTAGDLIAGLSREGARVSRHLPLEESLCHLIIAEEAS
ncbi:class I adenylate-forming enzyme family protein [Streptomyces sp. XH2]|uniref:class I adenylate-forming enzyme family protein n=1 Tax=Streptomyces sp. XH2 TaxID=3412483 RepID=UPI003C7DE727